MPRSYRLLKADEFSSVFSFRQSVAGEMFQIQFKPNGRDHPRLGMIVSRKTERLAVYRNFTRRIVREFFRTHLREFGGLDLVVRLRKPFRDAARARGELCELAGRVVHVSALDRTD